MIGQLNIEQIKEFLHTHTLGRIGCSHEGKPYVVPLNYVYDGNHIICHSLPGKKIEIMRINPQVCFEVDEMTDFTHWRSAILQAQYQELTEERERLAAMKLFVDRMMRLKVSETAILPEMAENRVHPRSPGHIKPIIFRLLIQDMTGRYEK
ncbi:MAG: pyridoxamine 5'-phosphate oxidase family protein [Bacteroidetes bacterium]|nr:pyridoxamine 5'-phosphate oxidase family protein [Bacteroidota bacterium]